MARKTGMDEMDALLWALGHTSVTDNLKKQIMSKSDLTKGTLMVKSTCTW